MGTATSTSTAHWDGSLFEGSGTVSTTSSALDAVPLTWKARTGGEAGSTPEELLAAAHAACFSMAFSNELAQAGHQADHVDVTATAEFGPVEGGMAVLGMRLSVEGVVPGIDEAAFLELANGAKDGCPLSKAIAGNVPVTLEAKLVATA